MTREMGQLGFSLRLKNSPRSLIFLSPPAHPPKQHVGRPAQLVYQPFHSYLVPIYV
jgi:hypothetical protein